MIKLIVALPWSGEIDTEPVAPSEKHIRLVNPSESDLPINENFEFIQIYDKKFCNASIRKRAIEKLNQKYPNHVVHLKFYENNPVECIKNLVRNTDRQESLAEETEIGELSLIYKVPIGEIQNKIVEMAAKVNSGYTNQVVKNHQLIEEFLDEIDHTKKSAYLDSRTGTIHIISESLEEVTKDYDRVYSLDDFTPRWRRKIKPPTDPGSVLQSQSEERAKQTTKALEKALTDIQDSLLNGSYDGTAWSKV